MPKIKSYNKKRRSTNVHKSYRSNYNNKNKDRIRLLHRGAHKRGSLGYAEWYVAQNLKKYHGISKEDINSEMIRLKKIQLLLKKTIREHKNKIPMRDAQYEHVRTKLLSLINKKIVYKTDVITISDYKFDGGKFIIEADGLTNDLALSISDAVDFVREAKLINDPNINQSNAETAKEMCDAPSLPLKDISITRDKSLTDSITKTVLESIEKIKKDPSYIPQANAIAQQIQTLLNIKRTEIELVKLSKKF